MHAIFSKCVSAAARVSALFFMLGLSLSACAENDVVTCAQNLTHSEGFTACVPEGFESTMGPTGFEFVETGNLRTPKIIKLEILPGGSESYRLDQSRALDGIGQTVRYGVRELGSGSAGTEYQLLAYLDFNGRGLLVTAREQTEFGQPDFATAWAVLDRIDFP